MEFENSKFRKQVSGSSRVTDLCCELSDQVECTLNLLFYRYLRCAFTFSDYFA